MSTDEILLTARLILVATSCVFATGLPVTLFFVRRAVIPLSPGQIWAAAPLVGTIAIVIVSQNLLYLDVRSPHSAIAIWIFGLLAGAKIMLSLEARALLKPVPWPLLALGALVYLIHGSGLLALGVSNYYGYGWVDMFNYVSQTQFFVDYPFSSGAVDQEFLRIAQFYMRDRIGQSVLHAFIAASGGADAQQAFGVTILLSPFLIFFSLYLLCSALEVNKRIAYVAALWGALSPAVATVHLECFFSQAIAMPFFILWPLAVSLLITNPGWRSTTVSAFLFAGIAAIYTELVVPLMATVLAALFGWRSPGVGASTREPPILTVIWAISASAIIALMINPGFVEGIIHIVSRTTTSNVLEVIYPWAFRADGLARLWIGNQIAMPTEWMAKGLAVFSIGLFFLGMGWLARRFVETKSLSALAVGFVMCFPLAPIFASALTGQKYPYQFYKLLLTVWPVVICCGLCGMFQLASQGRGRRAALGVAASLVMLNLLAVNRIAYASAKTETVAKSGRGGAHLLIDTDFPQMRKLLSGLSGRRVYLWWYDTALYEGAWRSRWLAYFARRNVVWSMINSQPSGAGELRVRTPPADAGSGTEMVGVTWKQIPNTTSNRIGSSFWIHHNLAREDFDLVDSESRITISRTLKLRVREEIDKAVWYPLWVAGKPGYATLLTVNFSPDLYRFRYDQWGNPATHLAPGGACSGKDIVLTLKIMQFEDRISLTCNGVTAEGFIPGRTCYLERDLPIEFGDNRGIDRLEGKYPLATRFPGSITELSRVH